MTSESRRDFLLKRFVPATAGALAGVAFTSPLVLVEAGVPDKKALEDYEKELKDKAKKNNQATPQPTAAPSPKPDNLKKEEEGKIVEESAGCVKPEENWDKIKKLGAHTDDWNGCRAPEVEGTTATPLPASTPAPTSVSRAASALTFTPTSVPRPQFAPTPVPVRRAADFDPTTYIRPGIIPNSLVKKIELPSGAPDMYEREYFKYREREWRQVITPHNPYSRWGAGIDRAGAPGFYLIGKKLDAFIKAYYNLDSDIAGQTWEARERILADAKKAGEDVTGAGICYAWGSTLALNKMWRNGFYHQESGSSFTFDDLGDGLKLAAMNIVPYRLINDYDFTPGTRAHDEAIYENKRWALRAFADGEPIVADKPRRGSTAAWHRMVRKVDISKFELLNVGGLDGEVGEDTDINEMKWAFRPIYVESQEARDPKFTSHPAWQVFRDEVAHWRIKHLDIRMLYAMCYPDQYSFPSREEMQKVLV